MRVMQPTTEWVIRAQTERALELIGNRLFLTVSEVAEHTRVDERTLRRALSAGTFPGVRIQNTWRIPAAAFLQICALTPDVNDGGFDTDTEAAA